MSDAQKRDRPPALTSSTYRVNTGYGNVYVTIGVDDGDPFEVFVNTGDSGGFTNAWCEALGKTISNALRVGADAEEVADDLTGIRTDRIAPDNGDNVRSIPDAVGIAMKRHVAGDPTLAIRGDAESGDPDD